MTRTTQRPLLGRAIWGTGGRLAQQREGAMLDGERAEAGRPSGGCFSWWSQEVTRGLVVKIESQDGSEMFRR